MSYGREFILTLFTNDPRLAGLADGAGVDRIGPDLERLGKDARQDPRRAWISDHSPADLPMVRAALARAHLFARTNPPNPGLGAEIDGLLAAGAQVLMLPMFTTAQQAGEFIDRIGGRARPVLLVETAAAARAIDAIAALPGVEEIHIGLNDLHLDLGLRSHFELLCSPLLDDLCAGLRARGILFGIGGIGRAGDTRLPIASDLIFAQYPRLGARAALVSRAFFASGVPHDLRAEVAAARRRLDHFAGLAPAELDRWRAELCAAVARLTGGAPRVAG